MNHLHSRPDARRRHLPAPTAWVALLAGSLVLLPGLLAPGGAGYGDAPSARPGTAGSAGSVGSVGSVATLSKDRGLRGIEPSSPLSMARRRARTRTRPEDFAPPRPPPSTRGPVGRVTDPRSEETIRALRTASEAFLSYGSTHRHARSGVVSSHSTTRPPPFPG